MARLLAHRTSIFLGLSVIAVVSIVVLEYRRTAPIRGSVRTFTELIALANQGDTDAARRLCTQSHLDTGALDPAPEGGIVGLPRAIHPNFQAWRQGDAVWICPMNRVGPIYGFRYERGRWRFDGLVGRLGADGLVERIERGSEGEGVF